MVGAFLYLTVCSAKNRIRRRLQRLREPRYFIGLIVGVLYFYFALFRRSGSARVTSSGATQSALHLVAGPVQFVGSMFLLVLALGAWTLPGTGRPIAFSRPEVQFLFTAPVTRRGLLHYKLLRSQLGVFFGAAVATLIMRPGSAAQGWTFMIGLWLLLMVVRLHLMGVSLRRNSLAEHGRSGFVRQWLPVSCVVGVVGVLATAAARGWPALAAASSAGSVFTELQRLATSGIVGLVLWPFRALARLPLSVSPAAFWRELPPVLVLLAGNYVWVMRSDAAFEEASADHAEQRAQTRSAPRPVARGTVSAPFRLAPDGPPEAAILWKNLILLGRYVSMRTLLRVLPLLVVLMLIARNLAGAGGIVAFLAALCVPLAAMTILFGPQMLRNDLRQDLANLAMIKAWPIRGAALIRGEVLAPTLVVSLSAWLFILAGAVLAGRLPIGSGVVAIVVLDRVSFATAAAIIAPALILSQTVIHNALAVLFPAWVTVGASRARGIDAMGQRLLMLAGITLMLTITVIPGAVAAWAVALIGFWLLGTQLIVLPALMVALVVAAECWLATELLGRVFDRTDISSVDAVE
jgi:ABC-2 type transport system permease protein